MKKVYKIPDMRFCEFKLVADILDESENDHQTDNISLDALNKGFKFQMSGGLGFGGPGFGWEE